MDILRFYEIDTDRIESYTQGKTSNYTGYQEKNPNLITVTFQGKEHLEYIKTKLPKNQENLNITYHYDNGGGYITIVEFNVDLVNSLHSEMVGNSKHKTSKDSYSHDLKYPASLQNPDFSSFGGNSRY